MYDDLDFLPVEHELVGVTSEEFKSGELNEPGFGEDNRCMQAVCSERNVLNKKEIMSVNFSLRIRLHPKYYFTYNAKLSSLG